MSKDGAFASSLAGVVERLPELVNGDVPLVRRGEFLTADFMIEVGSRAHYVAIVNGRIATLVPGPLLMRSWSFAIRGSEDAWRQFWRPLPPPHFHDIFALAKRGEFRIEGDFRPLMTNLLYFKALLAAPRALKREAHQ